MFWRSLVIFITLFWLVMVTLLVRVTYFPEGSQFAQMPPGIVLQMFLDHGASGKQLHLYHGEKKIGHLTLDVRGMPAAQSPGDYTLLLTGYIEKGALPDVASAVNLRLNINLREARRWAGAAGQIRLSDDGVLLDFKWLEGRATPEFTLHRKGVLQADDGLLQPMLGQFGAGTGAGAPPAGTMQDDFFKVSARESTMKIAGQKCKGYVIGFSILDRYHATAFFTEEGSLALIELPEGYRALEPNIHGLVPDEVEE
ncbi:MAG: hypothetical protein K8R87_01600 [Verrucomicrobia bacterium]|nr:hypothetical protein [Verrucomicrobiota bacterium]